MNGEHYSSARRLLSREYLLCAAPPATGGLGTQNMDTFLSRAAAAVDEELPNVCKRSKNRQCMSQNTRACAL